MITITPEAARQIGQVISGSGDKFLRIAVMGGGCSGLQYSLQIESEKSENDLEFESNGIKIIIDPISIRYLKGAEIDYSTTGLIGGFLVNNPNSKGTCGCGHSFEPKDP